MKALSVHTRDGSRERSRAMIEGRVLDLFRRIPLLLGFFVAEDLSLAWIQLHPAIGTAGVPGLLADGLRATESLISLSSPTMGDTT